MGPVKQTNWLFRISLSWGSASDIVQLQDLHQTAFISSLNWDVGQAIKKQEGLFSLNIAGTASYLTPQICEVNSSTYHLYRYSLPKS